MAKRKLSKNVKEWFGAIIMIISTSVIVFNNVGQSISLFQIPLSKIAMYWIAGLSFFAGVAWISYLNKIIKI